MIQQLHVWVYARRIGSRVWKKSLYTHVHSIIHNNWIMEAIQISIDGWTDQQNVIYTNNGIIFYLKNKEILTCATTQMSLRTVHPPTSLSTQFLWVFPVHQARALVSCFQPGLVICFNLDNTHVSMLFSRNIPPSRCLQSFLASGSFPISQFFASGGQSIGVLALHSKKVAGGGVWRDKCCYVHFITIFFKCGITL